MPKGECFVVCMHLCCILPTQIDKHIPRVFVKLCHQRFYVVSSLCALQFFEERLAQAQLSLLHGAREQRLISLRTALCLLLGILAKNLSYHNGPGLRRQGARLLAQGARRLSVRLRERLGLRGALAREHARIAGYIVAAAVAAQRSGWRKRLAVRGGRGASAVCAQGRCDVLIKKRAPRASLACSAAAWRRAVQVH